MIGGLGFQELLIILVIVLIIFGAGKLPSVGANLGKAIKGFKSSIGEDKPEELTSEQAAKTEQAQQTTPSGDKAGQAKPQA
ncbi:MAG: twin-arginine translocase TatA/TatE family subunit [Desulfarculus sp.]|nr:twin-arginine translocase TatA/TatE family subunit [Desulfarculus sp.]